MKTLKVAILSDGIWPYVIGGMQKHSYFLCKYLARNHINVSVYHTTKNNEDALIPKLSELFTLEELDYIKITKISYPIGRWYPGHYIRKSFLYSDRILKVILPDIQSYDAIYIQGFSGWSLLNKKNSGLQVPVCILNFHGLEMFQRPASFSSALSQTLFRPFVRRLINQTDYVQSLGGKLTELLLKIGVKDSKIIELGIGIDESWLDLKQVTTSFTKIRKFVFIGRYERRKGVEELNAILIKLEQSLNFEFHFIGPIPDNKRLNSTKIRYHGMVKDDTIIKKILGEADVLVCPSYSEGMPTVILEAMSQKCAIIATDVGAVSLLVNNKTGWLIPAANIRALEIAFKSAIDCDERKLMMKKQAAYQHIAENFTWPTICLKLIKDIKNRLN